MVPCFSVAASHGGEKNGSNQIYYFRILNSEVIISTAYAAVFVRTEREGGAGRPPFLRQVSSSPAARILASRRLNWVTTLLPELVALATAAAGLHFGPVGPVGYIILV